MSGTRSDNDKVCVVGASGKLGRYMVAHALERGYEVIGVCRERRVPDLAGFSGRITILPGMTDDLALASDTRWTVVRGSDLEEGPGNFLPVWSRHVGDPVLASNRTRRVDLARFMVEALANDDHGRGRR
jgi:hypothetical protein